MMPKILTQLKITEVSAVDRGAGEGVRILLMKRDEDEPYWKREFSESERRSAASSGAAESDGSFPIKNASDLHNAMRAIGRSKNPGKTRAHIRARARALGLSGELSDAFKREEPMTKFLDFFKAKHVSNAVHVQKATAALAKSVGVLLASEDSEEDKQKALAEAFTEFDDYVQKYAVSPDPVPDKTKETPPMLKELAKALGLNEDASEADVTKAIADRDLQIEVLKAGLTSDETAYHDKIGKAEDQASFRKLDHDGRKKLMTKQDDLPEYVRKLIAKGEEDSVRLAKLEEATELAKFEKIARDNGVPTTEAPALMKLAKADQGALDKLLAHTKAGWAAAEKAGVFTELGTTGGNGKISDKALDELTVKADELRKANPALTKEQAFAKVFTDPANIELAKRERMESASPIINPPGTMR